MAAEAGTARWWGTYRLPLGQAGRWRVGPLTLWIEHAQAEWRVASDARADPLLSAVEVEIPVAAEQLLTMEQVRRFAFAETSDVVAITPLLADRPVITRPEHSFFIPPGEHVQVFVGSPLWVDVGVDGTRLQEVAMGQVRQTWFGPSTMAGELCYATRTHCRLRLEDLPRRPHRAATRVLIKNLAESPLALERMEIPTPNLSLYHDAAAGHWWTQDVILERSASGGLAEVRLGEGAPSLAAGAALVTGPREKMAQSIVRRAFGTLFT